MNIRFAGLVIIYSVFAASMLTNSSSAYFTDTASSSQNTFSTAENFSEEETETVNPGDIVINEIMWAGTASGSADEWIELRNMTSSSIDLTGWKIDSAGEGTNQLILPTATIEANGYFLIANYDSNSASSILNITPDYVTSSIALTNSPSELLILRTSSDTLIDQANGTDEWLAGTNENPKRSMERKDSPGDGMLSGNWHSSTGQTNLDASAVDFGTPKAQNSTGL